MEPASLVRSFLDHPPQGFVAALTATGMPVFVTDYDLLTTVDGKLARRLARWLPRRWHTLRATFVGTTVTEYVQLPPHASAQSIASDLLALRRQSPLLIVKDLPVASPLLDKQVDAQAVAVRKACRAAGFILVAGQALAYVPIDFTRPDEYLAARSASRRKDLRRKLKSRGELAISATHTGDSAFAEPVLLAEMYALYLAVHAQSEIHFDLLTPQFFQAVLGAAGNGGIVFMYRHHGELIGYNLCFVCGDKLVDKFIGLRYPQARELNLYFVSWMHNLEYALAAGLKYYVAGWTDPQVKKDLGASFTWTEHAVYVRNPALRAVLRLMQSRFESDAGWQRGQGHAPLAGT
ncbi:MAG: GNAT family N-acetyltransferase [Pseudomonadota bacterium]